jgi:ABC-type Co2+ transport system permease subunit
MQEFLAKFARTLSDLEYHTVIAGFFGGVIFVAFTKNLSRLQMFTSIITGLLSAYYLTSLFCAYASKLTGVEFSVKMESGVAFLIGITALYIIPAIIRKINKVGV